MAEGQIPAPTMEAGHRDSEHFSPYRADGKLYGFVCVVTGADQPIGQAIVKELAAHGAASIYACHPLDSPTPNLPQSKTAKTIPYPYDPTSEHATLTLIDEILHAYGRLDIWTCSPLTNPPFKGSSITSTTPNYLLESFESAAMPAFLALKYAPAAMQKLSLSVGAYPNAAPKDVKYGSIIVVNATSSSTGPGPAHTIATSAALGVVKSGVAVLKGTGVRVNAISAGVISSSDEMNGESEKADEMGKIGLERAGRPEEVGRVAGFLASGFSSYVNGSEMRVDGGSIV